MRPRSRPLTFADFELQSQGIALEATLQARADFLDEHADLVTLVHQDLVRGLKRPQSGRDGLSAAQVLRAFVLQRVKHWDLRELRERIADGYTLRRFTTFDGQAVPQHDAFHRAFCRLTPATVRALNDAVVHAAVGLGLEDGAQLCVDTAVVETDIHWPTDSALLWDVVRVITRLVQRVGEQVPSALSGFADRTRRARRRMQEISRLVGGAAAAAEAQVSRAPRRHDRRRRDGPRRGRHGADGPTRRSARTGPREQPGRRDRALLRPGRARHRANPAPGVLEGEQLPVHQKTFSIFEPHTDLIKRGKAQRPVEFGHKVFLAESGRGLITDYRVLDGNPVDEVHVPSSLTQHQATFGRVPTL